MMPVAPKITPPETQTEFYGLLEVVATFGEALTEAGILDKGALADRLLVLVAEQVREEGRVETQGQSAARALYKFFSEPDGNPMN